jgi:hypothetical protein
LILEFLMTFAPSPLMGEGEDEGENQDFDSRLGVLNYPRCNFKHPPHLNPLPPGERKTKQRTL